MYQIANLSQAKRIKTLKKIQSKDLLDKVASLTCRRRSLLNYLLLIAPKLKCLYMSQSFLAQRSGFRCRQNVNIALALFKDLGWVDSRRRRYNYGWKSNIYSVSQIFYKEARDLYPLLSSLRSCLSWVKEKATQLNKRLNNNSLSTVESVSMETKKEPILPKPPDPPDVMSWDMDILRQLAAQSTVYKVEAVRQRSVSKPSSAYKPLGEITDKLFS